MTWPVTLKFERVPCKYPDIQDRWDTCPAHDFRFAVGSPTRITFRCRGCGMPRTATVGPEMVTYRDGEQAW